MQSLFMTKISVTTYTVHNLLLYTCMFISVGLIHDQASANMHTIKINMAWDLTLKFSTQKLCHLQIVTNSQI